MYLSSTSTLGPKDTCLNQSVRVSAINKCLAAGSYLTVVDAHGVHQARFDAQVAASIVEEEMDIMKGQAP